jgi:hypothetical protein
MPGDTFATRSLDELARQLRQRDAKPELASRSAPRNPNLASVSNTLAGILLYLVFIGSVATVIIGVCFGVGFFLVTRAAAPVSGETKMRGSAATAALPVFPPAERPATGKMALPKEGSATRVSALVSSMGESTASGRKGRNTQRRGAGAKVDGRRSGNHRARAEGFGAGVCSGLWQSRAHPPRR